MTCCILQIIQYTLVYPVKHVKIQQAKISFNSHGTPESAAFDDLYYSNKSGFEETHYVFIEGNQLIESWENCQQRHFTIAETGFGTGLNFLCAAYQFDLFRQKNPDHPLKKLFFVSTEKFPLSLADLSLALNNWPSLNVYAQQLIKQYPTAVSGAHRLNLLEGLVILDLHFGDAIHSFSNMHVYEDGLVDAWFLDGFAPRKNDELWGEGLFSQLARLSRQQASFATFTAASAVRRGLEAAGFQVNKRKGFGKKREMIFGNFQGLKTHSQVFKHQHPVYYRAPLDLAVHTDKRPHIAVIGAGIAGAISALKLIQQGCKVDLYCADSEVAQGASGNPLGGFYPQLNAEAGINSQIHIHSFMYAQRFYQHLNETGINFEHDWCGVLQLGFNPNQLARIQKLRNKATWPVELVRYVDAHEASQIANIKIEHDALFLQKAGWISPPDLVRACIEHCRSNKPREFKLSLNTRLTNMKELSDTCRISLAQDDSTFSADYDGVILTMGNGTPASLTPTLPYRLTRGQVELVKASASSSALNTVLCHKGYMTPAINGIHAMGSTYVKDDTNIKVRIDETHKNIDMHLNAMHSPDWLSEICAQHGGESARAAVRCSLPDHLPVVGEYPDIASQKERLADLYKAKMPEFYSVPNSTCRVMCLTGLGSRGLTTAPLLAEIAVSQLLKRALPMQNQLLDALNPNRFLVRSLIRRQEY